MIILRREKSDPDPTNFKKRRIPPIPDLQHCAPDLPDALLAGLVVLGEVRGLQLTGLRIQLT